MTEFKKKKKKTKRERQREENGAREMEGGKNRVTNREDGGQCQ